MASPVETEPWRWGCGGICRTTKQGAHVECAFCTRKFHLVCLPHICPASEIPEPHALYVCHAGCRQAFQAGADKRVYCKQKGCPHIKGFANVRALRVHVKHVHEGLRHACALCGEHYTTKVNRDDHQSKCAVSLTGVLQRRREAVVAELEEAEMESRFGDN